MPDAPANPLPAGGTSPHGDPDPGPSSPAPPHRGRALAVYLASAALVRTASGGAPVGLVSLTLDRYGHGGAALGGLLAALLTAPNLAGPWTARWLESARDTRPVLAGAFAAYGIALAGAALALGHVTTAAVAAVIVLGGLAGPLMTGGLSSRLALLVGGDDRDRRRAEGWDSATYGVGNIAGPGVVAGLAGTLGPLPAVLALGAAAVLAGLLLSLLPRGGATAADGESMPVRDALRVVLRTGPLRRVMAATTITSVSTGGILVVAVVLGGSLGHSPGAGATLGAVYGAGNLCGALLTGVFPSSGEPERRTVRLVAVNALAIGLCALSPGYVVALFAFALAGATSAVLFTATLAVRSVYSPPAARAQVFVTMACAKMASGAAGTALAGTLVGIGPRLALALGAIVVASAVLAAVVDRRVSAARGGPG
ncbi:MFS transporter [Streptomyces sp. NPDC090306]|uniref:MFS transporter n=1 Tax=Streptomyces sp. NPDC090306 TaxID=3365961 RepID=UPI00381CB849